MTERKISVYTLMVDVGRAPDDGLPEDCDGAAMLCYCAARTEREAVDETVKVLREAGLSPLEVQSYGTLADRDSEGQAISDEDRALMARAAHENAVIVAQVVPFIDEDEDADSEAPDASGNVTGAAAGRGGRSDGK